MLLSTPAFDSNIQAPDFTLPDVISEQPVSLSDSDLSNGFVVAFICNHCPYVKEMIEDFVGISRRLQEQGTAVFAIMPNNYEFVPMDGPEYMKTFAQQHEFTFPYLVDETQEIAKAYDAVCTPDIFGFNADLMMQFRGHVAQLEQAMTDIAAIGSTNINQEPSRGCSIKWK